MSQVQTFVDNKSVVTATATTIGAVTADVITIDLGAIPGTYLITASVAGFDATPLGIGYYVTSCFRTTGVVANEVQDQQSDNFEEGVLIACTIDMAAVGNTAVLRVLGTAGHTIRWTARLSYIFGS